MWEGWSHQRATQLRLQYAQTLTAAGVQFRPLHNPEDNLVVGALVMAHVQGMSGFALAPEEGGAVALDSTGAIIGAATVAASQHNGGLLVLALRHLVTDSNWRGQGIGTVLLGLLPQFGAQLGKHIDVTIGNCAPGLAARFYQRAGFTVGDPNQPLPVPGLAAMVSTSSHYPCWMTRPW